MTSFANTSGGDLFVGIREVKGAAAELIGIEVENVDQEVLRLENLIRDGVEPRLPSVDIRRVRLLSGRLIFAISISRSWALPHMVRFKGHDKFYARNAGGKYPLDVSGLRGLFLASGALAERLRRFRLDRLASIQADGQLFRSPSIAKLVIHMIPVAAFDSGFTLDLREAGSLLSNLSLVWDEGGEPRRHNFDGVIVSRRDSAGLTCAYTQLFRNGMIEAVDADFFQEYKEEGVLPGAVVEESSARAVERFCSIQRSLEVPLPVFVGISLLGVLGCKVGNPSAIFVRGGHAIDRNELIIPEIGIEDFRVDTFKLLRPAFDVIWNAAGRAQSPNYDQEGNWKQPR